jgi:uncharacterized damage-inducible protein DinB
LNQLIDLLEYNVWANDLVLAETDKLSADALAADMPELGGSALGLMEHTAQVQAAFLSLVTGGELKRPTGGKPYAEVAALLRETGEALYAAVKGSTVAVDGRVLVPWFQREFSVEQVLVQVATHSVQHRAGICAGIFRGGGTAPGLDYIMWLSKAR